MSIWSYKINFLQTRLFLTVGASLMKTVRTQTFKGLLVSGRFIPEQYNLPNMLVSQLVHRVSTLILNYFAIQDCVSELHFNVPFSYNVVRKFNFSSCLGFLLPLSPLLFFSPPPNNNPKSFLQTGKYNVIPLEFQPSYLGVTRKDMGLIFRHQKQSHKSSKFLQIKEG